MIVRSMVNEGEPEGAVGVFLWGVLGGKGRLLPVGQSPLHFAGAVVDDR